MELRRILNLPKSYTPSLRENDFDVLRENHAEIQHMLPAIILAFNWC